jgi:hypothetical protein
MDEAVDVPIACLLTAPELRVRRQSALAALRAAQLEARELTDAGGVGYAFRFAPSADQLAHWPS